MKIFSFPPYQKIISNVEIVINVIFRVRLVTNFESLESQKYILLETYRKNNSPVRTPVWYVLKNKIIYIVTREKTGKIKRLKNNLDIRIAICSFNGKPKGNWISGTAKFANKDETKTAIELRGKKYGFMEKIARFVSKNKGDLVVFSIKLNSD